MAIVSNMSLSKMFHPLLNTAEPPFQRHLLLISVYDNWPSASRRNGHIWSVMAVMTRRDVRNLSAGQTEGGRRGIDNCCLPLIHVTMKWSG
jgi:hypothetical protein